MRVSWVTCLLFAILLRNILQIGALSNSHRQVESEIMCYLMNIIQIDEKIAIFNEFNNNNNHKPLLEQSLLLLKKSSVRSLAASDWEQFDTHNL